jgi:hypothetical protein
MKRIALILAAFVAVVAFSPEYRVRAQVPAAPTPSPDPHSYVDPGMNFTAPADAVLVGRRYPTLAELSNDLQPVAVWVLHPGKEDQRTIQILMESFQAAPDQWEGQFESQMHNTGGQGLLIRNKTPMGLLNGMPATFVEVTAGSGFDSKKEFAVVWADGQRGVVLAESGRLGDASSDEAKTVLHNVTAVRYPLEQP